MSRDVPFDENATCDVCAKTGAFDFMGDFICSWCLEKVSEDDDEPLIDEECEARSIDEGTPVSGQGRRPVNGDTPP
jgi:hypothetical protein